VRPAAVVNELIRALFQRAGGRLYGEDRVTYAQLVTEWATAVQAEAEPPEIVEAA
jgi:hypothetical protein